jgi:hypothetical protein
MTDKGRETWGGGAREYRGLGGGSRSGKGRLWIDRDLFKSMGCMELPNYRLGIPKNIALPYRGFYNRESLFFEVG